MVDIVIPYKKSYTNELMYTLRSLKNIPHRNVYIIGDKTNYRVKHIPYTHTSDIAKNTYNILRIAAETKEVSSNFIWMHDDMMFLQPLKELPVFHLGLYDDIIPGLPNNYTLKTNSAHLHIAPTNTNAILIVS